MLTQARLLQQQTHCASQQGEVNQLTKLQALWNLCDVQELGWYDEDKNNSGVLINKLSSDALAIKGQFGDTMGMLTQVCSKRRERMQQEGRAFARLRKFRMA